MSANDAWIDVSVSLREGMLHWPGDPPMELEWVKRLDRGDSADVSRLRLGAHTGTHMDAPRHFVPGAAAIDAMPIDATVGRARVVAIADPAAVRPAELEPLDLQPGERVLFKTRNSERPWGEEPFREDFVYVSLEAARYLAERRVRAVGVDYLSVGGFHADGVAIHRALLEAGVWVIEGLYLGVVPPGPCELVCLPLKVTGGEGAPARAAVRPLGGAA